MTNANDTLVTVTDENFAEEVEQAAGLVVVDFWAAWCGPCRMVAPTVEQLARDYEGRVKVGKLDVDQSQQTAARLGIRSIPAILFFKGGRKIDSVVGAVPRPVLQRKFEEHLG